MVGALLTPGGSVLLLALLAAEAAALRVGGPPQLPHPRHAAAVLAGSKLTCPAEHGIFPEAPARPQQLLQVSSELHAESASELEAESGRNFSFVRECRSIADKLSMLQPLLIPRLKLAFCYVPKVACTQFKDLFNFLNGLGNETLGFGHHYFMSMPKRLHMTMQNVTRENGWKFAAFTRDPLLRYLSAFGSTCVSTSGGKFEHVYECCGPTIQMPISDEDMIRRFEQRMALDAAVGLVRGDDHWVEQSEIMKQCSWRNFKPESLDYWGHLSGDVNQQVKSMLKVVNFTDDRVVDTFFPKNTRAGHTSPITVPPRELFRNKAIVKSLLKVFEDDYKRLPGVGCSFTDYILNGTSVFDLLNITTGLAAAVSKQNIQKANRPAGNWTRPRRNRTARSSAVQTAQAVPAPEQLQGASSTGGTRPSRIAPDQLGAQMDLDFS